MKTKLKTLVNDRWTKFQISSPWAHFKNLNFFGFFFSAASNCLCNSFLVSFFFCFLVAFFQIFCQPVHVLLFFVLGKNRDPAKWDEQRRFLQFD